MPSYKLQINPKAGRNYKVLVVDDQKEAAFYVHECLDKLNYSFLRVVDEAYTIDQALNKIRYHQPDIVFLDYLLPDKNHTAIDLIEKCIQNQMLNFITVFYSEESEKEFRKKARQRKLFIFLDKYDKYLDKEELIPALSEAIDRINELEKPKRESKQDALVRIVDLNDELHIIDPCEIILIRGDDQNSNVYLQGGVKISAKQLLKDILILLPEEFFVKTHKSFVVNLKFIDKIEEKGKMELDGETLTGDGGKVILQNGNCVPISRAKADQTKEAFRNYKARSSI